MYDCIYTFPLSLFLLIGLVGRVFVNGSRDMGSITKTLKMPLYTSLLNTQQYKVRVTAN